MIILVSIFVILTIISLAIYYVIYLGKLYDTVEDNYGCFETRKELVMGMIPYQMWFNNLRKVYNKLK